MLKYIGQCNKLRELNGNENHWQKMIENGVSTTLDSIIDKCDFEPILDDGETIEDYVSDNPGIEIYKSVWNDSPCVFLQIAGFEFIWTTSK